MTETTIPAGRDLDLALARLLGYRIADRPYGGITARSLQDPRGVWVGNVCVNDDEAWGNVPQFSGSSETFALAFWLRRRAFAFRVEITPGDVWRATFRDPVTDQQWLGEGNWPAQATALAAYACLTSGRHCGND